MKKLPLLKQLLAVLCCMIYLQNQSFAQEKKRKVLFGVQGGVNVNKISPPANVTRTVQFGSSYKWTPSYNFGGFVDFYLAKRLYFESGVNILSRKSDAYPKTITTVSFYRNLDDGPMGYDLNLNTSFNHEILALQIPFSLHVDIIKKDNFRANIFVGIAIEKALKYKVEEKNSTNWQSVNVPQDVLNEAEKYINGIWGGHATIFNKTSYGGMMGVGVNYKKIGLDINYSGSERTTTYGNGIPGTSHYRMPSFIMNLRFQIN